MHGAPPLRAYLAAKPLPLPLPAGLVPAGAYPYVMAKWDPRAAPYNATSPAAFRNTCNRTALRGSAVQVRARNPQQLSPRFDEEVIANVSGHACMHALRSGADVHVLVFEAVRAAHAPCVHAPCVHAKWLPA